MYTVVEVQVKDREVVVHSRSQSTMRWIAVELERADSIFDYPQVIYRGGEWLFVVGFKNQTTALACGVWLGELLIKLEWKENEMAVNHFSVQRSYWYKEFRKKIEEEYGK